MSQPVSFDCPRCGAPLQAAEGQFSVKCEYCGGTIVVPPELRPASPPPPPEALHPAMISVVISTSGGEESQVWAPPQVAVPAGARSRRRGGCAATLVMLIALSLVVSGAVWLLNTRTPYFFDNLVAGGFARLDQTFSAQVDGTDLLDSPAALTIDGKNNVYVLDDSRQMVVRFDEEGTYLGKWKFESKSTSPTTLVADRAGGIFVVRGDLVRYDASTGSLLGTGGVADIFGVGDVCVLPNGNLIGYVNGSTGDSLVRLDVTGAEIGRRTRAISESTSDAPPLTWDVRLAAGRDGSVYLLSTTLLSEAVYIYDPDLHFKLHFGTNGSADGQLDSPSAIAVDSKGRIYVDDWKGVQVFDAKGTYIGIIRLPFRALASGMAFNSKDELFFVTRSQNKVYKFVLNAP